jgi:hypothetical protein
MKYSLSFCDITKISENTYETVGKEGIVLDKECAEEAWNFWDTLCKEPFGLLVNSKNTFSHSFEGAMEIGKHPLQKKTALLVYNDKQTAEFKTALQIKQVTNHYAPHKIFSDREKAIEWLKDLA